MKPAFAVILAPVVAVLLLQTAGAATLLVYNTNDSGAGSLRQAIATNASLGGGNAISFSNGINGTITLTSGELFITNNVTILGPGANVLAVNGNFPITTNPVFHVAVHVISQPVTVFISGLTVSNGYGTRSPFVLGGGGIYNDHATLTVSNCTISGNSAAYAGGGIADDQTGASGTLTMFGSTVSGNSAPNGGGIYNDGEGGGHAMLALSNCTISGNSAGTGGGIYNDGAGSAGFASLTVIGSTLSGNSATNGASIYSFYSQVGGNATVEIGGTILNAGALGVNIDTADELAPVTSDGYNLCSDDGSGYLNATGDQTNSNPMLGPLQNNGGPTPTMALLWGSPAIDQGKSFGMTTDQRGAPRPYVFPSITKPSGGDGSDIGAYEFIVTSLNIAHSGSDSVLSWPTLGAGFRLQSTTNLSSPAKWTNVSGNPFVIGSQFYLTNPVSAPQTFYRLVNP